MTKSRPILVAIGCAIIVALLGGFASQPGAWYEALEKSTLTPPNWVFGPAWTLIYASCVIAAVMGWRRAETASRRAWLKSLFFINAVSNILWSFLFFTLERPDWALGEVVVLWVSVAALILFFRKFSMVSAVILVPYLLWVSFASYLNFQIVVLNGPFG